MPKPSEVFRKNLKFFLKEKAWNQADLARAMGVKPQAVNKYFAEDVEPKIDSLSGIAQAFGVEPYELLVETDEEALPRVAVEIYRGTIELQAKQIDRMVREMNVIKALKAENGRQKETLRSMVKIIRSCYEETGMPELERLADLTAEYLTLDSNITEERILSAKHFDIIKLIETVREYANNWRRATKSKKP